MFFQGAGGDQNPMPRKSVALAKQFGRTLASSVERVLEEEMQALSPKLLTTYSEVDLTLIKPSEGELKQVEAEFAENQWHWAEKILDKTRKAESPKTYRYPLQIWGLGEQLVISLGGEPVVAVCYWTKTNVWPKYFCYGVFQ